MSASAVSATPNAGQSTGPPSASGPPQSTLAAARTAIQFKALDDVFRLAQALYVGGVRPTGVDRPESLVPIILTGLELGMPIMQACSNMMLQNGRVSMWGDAGLALVRASGKLVSIKEWRDGDGDARRGVCEIQRVGGPVKQFEYTIALAKKLKSFGAGKAEAAWQKDPDNMLMWRARWRALRTEFGDVLMGIVGAEEEEDVMVVTATVRAEQPASPAATPALPASAAPPVSAVPPVSAAPAGGGITTPQLTELARLRGLLFDSLGSGFTAEEKNARWAEELAPYSVKSARDLTQAQAEELILSIGRVQDPFTYPNSTGSAPT